MLYIHKVFVHTTYRKPVHMLYGHKVVIHTTYRQLVHMFYRRKLFFMQYMDNLSICCMDITVFFIKHMYKLSICCMGVKKFHATYRQLVHMLYGQLNYRCVFVQTDWINYIILCFIKLIWVWSYQVRYTFWFDKKWWLVWHQINNWL